MRRRAAVSGSWYPDDPTRLASELTGYLNRATREPGRAAPRALIAPHAGLMYSGPVAAFAYKVVAGASYRAAVLVGPSHFVPFDGVSIWSAGEWETPFGPVAVDGPLAEAVRAACGDAVDLPAAHAREHSLEMQLPFLAYVLPGLPIVPIVMGRQTRQTAFALGDALARTIVSNDPNDPNDSNDPNDPNDPNDGPNANPNDSNDSNVLLIASSDLSHYENAAVAAHMDAIMVRHVDALDPDGLMAALEHEPRHACGGGPMVAVLHAARRLGASSSRVVRYADSGDVSGDKTAVVGYLAAVIA